MSNWHDEFGDGEDGGNFGGTLPEFVVWGERDSGNSDGWFVDFNFWDDGFDAGQFDLGEGGWDFGESDSGTNYRDNNSSIYSPMRHEGAYVGNMQVKIGVVKVLLVKVCVPVSVTSPKLKVAISGLVPSLAVAKTN